MPEPRNQGPAKQPPHRYRLNVPNADEAVAAWMEMQDNQSLSIRMLIRESIERYGYVDIVNRPVVQLPEGGRVPVPAAEPETSADPASAPQQADQSPNTPVDVNDLFAQLRR